MKLFTTLKFFSHTHRREREGKKEERREIDKTGIPTGGLPPK